MRACTCGNTTFTAKQLHTVEVIIDGDGNIKEEVETSSVGEPFHIFCTKCDKEYGLLSDLD